jgi:hypothetical protein
MPDPSPLPPVVRLHLDALSDGRGIFQHARGGEPEPALGYSTDDVARALQVDLLHSRVVGWPAVAASAWRNLHFLEEAVEPGGIRFRGLRGVDGEWAREPGSEDCQGRAIQALGEAIACAPSSPFTEAATRLFGRAIRLAPRLLAARPIASAMLGCDAAIRGRVVGRPSREFSLLAERLLAAFEPHLATAWPWPEPRLTCEGGLLPQALLIAGVRGGDGRAIDAGVAVLDWLVSLQVSPAGHLSPVGNAWWGPGEEWPRFDQQPIEATALLVAAETAYDATGDDRHRRMMEIAFEWFGGGNDLGIPVADPGRGACFDALTPTGVDVNQGAESTLMWLTAVEHVRAVRDRGRGPQVHLRQVGRGVVA